MSSFVHFIAASGSGITPPSPGAYSLLDTLSATAYPFQTYGPICISRDGYTVFALGNDNGQLGVWVWRWNGTAWPNLQILHLSTSGDAAGMTPSTDGRLITNEDGSAVLLGIRSAASNKGVVYVFTEASPNTWSEFQRIPNPDAQVSYFGHGIASDLTTNRFVVGAPYHDDGATDGFGNPLWGKLYFYVLSGGSYTAEDTITATKPVYGGGGGGLGDFVSMDGNGALVVAGDNDYTDSFLGVGTMDSYTRSGSAWSFVDRRAPVDDDINYSLISSRARMLTEDGSALYAQSDLYDTIAHYTISGGVFTFQSMLVGPLAIPDAYGPLKYMGMSEDGGFFAVGTYVYDGTNTNQGRVDRWVSGAYSSSEVATGSGLGTSYEMGRGADLSADGSIAVWTIPQQSGSPTGIGDRVYAKVY